jgi:hypothetical protein
MTVSDDTAIAIYRVMLRHVPDEKIDAILRDLVVEVRGNLSFRDTIHKLDLLHKKRKKHRAVQG